jgi:hypothetical protein
MTALIAVEDYSDGLAVRFSAFMVLVRTPVLS